MPSSNISDTFLCVLGLIALVGVLLEPVDKLGEGPLFKVSFSAFKGFEVIGLLGMIVLPEFDSSLFNFQQKRVLAKFSSACVVRCLFLYSEDVPARRV